ncbi:MAG: hypothetical protein M3340_15385 [Actinomycetota bacterium]|nr:hypothetical protein [Actinomycetota bacterium]
MTGIELAAVIALGVWMATLSLCVALCVRQVGLLTVRVQAGAGAAEELRDGLEIGQQVPGVVQRALPSDGGVTYVLAMEAGCVACRQLADQLRDVEVDARIVAFVQGTDAGAGVIAELLEKVATVVRDPDARDLTAALEIELTPTVLELDRGFVTGKGVIRDVDDVVSLINAREYSDAAEIPKRATELGGYKLEVYGGRD